MQCRVDVAVMIGSGVPPGLRAMGQSVCWVVLLNGERRGTAFASRDEAEECRAAWLAQLKAEVGDSLH
ncbi:MULTISPECIES: hypothetical protein [Pseudomonas]|uniref:hypothetical protein n=1 Tax=Pseudomonas TaxID=286 RepID=UPI001B32BA5F|nr:MULTISPECIES: hypothetical protein [Pseudomonas]MBP5943219.1 hypothetical protein [Pseudomonas sp. P9(2020)]MBP5954498.1 hypothetical protein [Pseudomonas anatoliensis]MBZ9562135.1 hypothetical protein [Pseudomonas sp. P116]